jgi:CrcB protein
VKLVLECTKMEEQQQQQQDGDDDHFLPTMTDYGCRIDEGLELFPDIVEAFSGGTEVISSLLLTSQPPQLLESPPTSNTSWQDGKAIGDYTSDDDDEVLRRQYGIDDGGPNNNKNRAGKRRVSSRRRGGMASANSSSLPLKRVRTDGSHSAVDSVGSDKTAHKIVITRPYQVKEHYLEALFYVSVSAIVGSSVRIYMARFFGKDCEVNVDTDFFTSLSANICVTNGGRTYQTGGALFYDFPANVVGCFVMGLITPGPDTHHRARIPWLHREHPLQRDDVFLESLGIGFCGSLTTFASWNTQMIVMLDGTHCDLGSQIVPVLLGYVLGLMGAFCGFQFGRQIGLWMYDIKHSGEGEAAQLSWEEEMEKAAVDADTAGAGHRGVELVDDVDRDSLKPVPNHLHKIPLFLTAIGLLVAFVVAGFVYDNSFYQGMTLQWFGSPVGSLLRWRLSVLNSGTREDFCLKGLPRWVPWGTVCANVSAAVIGAVMTGLDDRYFSSSSQSTYTDEWLSALIFAINSGLAGSLSTVSTLMKETVVLMEKHNGEAKSHYYAFGTCFFSMLLGLALYSATVRINT